ncbi:hypothetical protein TBLA_0E01160 [Henningerozyma blattae CBS 6284]|uniref:SET domain-containing protein n=1 Tax=Henningerozyma blattae (strain ATCC 34711 / CBS 6284 / DSM 70876 / NBRC 10599 / NRRL Y-10934 / UCD 77-7) TaxID=1071380 RepID=I2H473_HENB6|nr:hypothetical protein TBLA_0E01160 [Tetrapisispora blattae CBS 6284]CCH61175.1 hypothetical protein TBLA_0E01160 [Tetrapisispora blattae CBS 6284]
MTSTSSAKQSLLEDCLNWAKSNGAIIDDKIEFKLTESSGFSAFTTEKIVPDSSSPLIQIPKQLLITKDLALTHFNNPSSNDISNTSWTQLYLANLKFNNKNPPKESEFFKPYLNLLSFADSYQFPFFWNYNDLQHLKGTDLLIRINYTLRNLINEWKTMLTQLNIPLYDPDILTIHADNHLNDYINEFFLKFKNKKDSNLPPWNSFLAYLWSYCIFLSRAFPELILHEQEQEQEDDSLNQVDLNSVFLFPIVDLLNHSNNSNVIWNLNPNDKNSICFNTIDPIEKSQELFNNYGNKSTEDFLLSYGFILKEETPFDYASLTLRLDKSIIQNLKNFGLGLNDNFIVGDDKDTVQFKLFKTINNKNKLERDQLINLFGYLNKLTTEKNLNFRSVLQGLDQLTDILQQKIEITTKLSKLPMTKNSDQCHFQIIKNYINIQKKLFIGKSESIQRYQKKLISSKDPTLFNVLSFKTILKLDQLFANSILLTLGVRNYDDIIKKDCLNDIIMLWLVRISNRNNYKKKLPFELPDFIPQTFETISKNIIIEKDDVMELMTFYNKYFPQLKNSIPELYGIGEWGIRQFVVADAVIDSLVWQRKVNNEAYFIEDKTVTKNNIIF